MTTVMDRPVDTGGTQQPDDGPSRRRPRDRFAVRALTGALLPLLVAAAFLGSTFGGWWPPLLLAGQCLAVLLLTVVAQFVRIPRVIAAVGIGVIVVVLGYLMVIGAPRIGPDARVDRPAWRILLDSVASLLSTPAGTPARLDLVAPAFLLVGLGGVFALTRAQMRGPGRTMGVAPALIAPLIYAAGQVLSAGRADRSGLIAAAVLLVIVLGWSRLSVATAGAAAVCAVCATLVAFLHPGAGWDVREYVTPPRIVVDQPSLSPYLPQWAMQSDTVMFTVDGTVPNRIAVAVYSGYDGNSWSTADDFALFGSTRSSLLGPGRFSTGYRMHVTPGALEGNWLPAAGWVQAISVPDAVQDLTGGSMARIGQSTEPVAYTVSGRVPLAPDDAVAAAGVPDRESAAAFLDTPPLGDGVRAWVQQTVGDYPGRYDQAAALENALRQGRTVDAEATGSASMFAIAQLVGADGNPPADAAPVENFVTAFAVLARSIGLPTRVVVGAKLSDAQGVAEVHMDVRARSMTMWPEVYFSSIGWTAFNPVPGSTASPAPVRHERLTAEQQQRGDTGKSEDIPVTDPDAGDPAAAAGSDAGGWAPVLRVGGVAGLGAVLAAIVAALLAGAVVLARLRRRGAVGAWAAIERGVRQVGVRVPSDWSTERAAGAVGAMVDGDVARAAMIVARQAERQRFAPPGTPVDDTVWADATRVRRALRGTRSWPGRVGWYLRPAAWRASR